MRRKRCTNCTIAHRGHFFCEDCWRMLIISSGGSLIVTSMLEQLFSWTVAAVR